MRNPESCELSSGGASASHRNEPGSRQPHAHNVMRLSLSITALGAYSSDSQHQSHALKASCSLGASLLWSRSSWGCAKWPKHCHTALLFRQENLTLPNCQKNFGDLLLHLFWPDLSCWVVERDPTFFCELSYLLSLSLWLEKYITIFPLLLTCREQENRGKRVREVNLNLKFSSKNHVVFVVRDPFLIPLDCNWPRLDLG